MEKAAPDSRFGDLSMMSGRKLRGRFSKEALKATVGKIDRQ
jgi:hypothetical protein